MKEKVKELSERCLELENRWVNVACENMFLQRVAANIQTRLDSIETTHKK